MCRHLQLAVLLGLLLCVTLTNAVGSQPNSLEEKTSASSLCQGQMVVKGTVKASLVLAHVPGVQVRSSGRELGLAADSLTATVPVDAATGAFAFRVPEGADKLIIRPVLPSPLWAVDPPVIELDKADIAGFCPSKLPALTEAFLSARRVRLTFTLLGVTEVSGRVVVSPACSDAGEPVKDVLVKVGAAKNATTDAMGYYSISAVPFGTHQVTFSRTDTVDVITRFPSFLVPDHSKDDVVPVRIKFRGPEFFVVPSDPAALTSATLSLHAESEGSGVVVPFTRADDLIKKGKVPRVLMELVSHENGRISRAVLLRNHVAIFPPQLCGMYDLQTHGDHIQTVPERSSVMVFGGQPSFSEVVYEPLEKGDL